MDLDLWDCLRRVKIGIIAKFHSTDLVIWSHSIRTKPPSYSWINTVYGINFLCSGQLFWPEVFLHKQLYINQSIVLMYRFPNYLTNWPPIDTLHFSLKLIIFLFMSMHGQPNAKTVSAWANCEDLDRTVLTLKAQNKNCSRRHFNIFTSVFQ